MHDPLRAGGRQARRARRQRLLGHLRPCRSRPARRPPRHHALACARGSSSPTYPNVKLEPDQIFVRDGNIWSSAGITAGIDLALAMVADDYGDEIVQKTARQLVLYHRRSGGQSQFSSLLELKAPTGRFGPLLTWAREHLDGAAHGGRSRRSRRHERAAFHPRLHRGDRHHAVEGDRAAAHRGGAGARAVFVGGDRARRRDHRLPRSGADAPRLHPRLRPAAAIVAESGEGRLVLPVSKKGQEGRFRQFKIQPG